MASNQQEYKDRQFLAVIGDEVGAPYDIGSGKCVADEPAWTIGLSDWTAPRRNRCTSMRTLGNTSSLTIL